MDIGKLDLQREAKQARRIVEKASKHPVSDTAQPVRPIAGRGYRETRRGFWAAVGAGSVLALIGTCALAIAALNKSDGLSSSARGLCDDIPSVGNIVEDGCTIHVPSIVQVKPRNPDVTEGVEGTIEFVLSGETKAGKLTRGNGIGLAIPTDVIPSDNYADAFVSIADPTGENVGPAQLMEGYRNIVENGGEVAVMAEQKCAEEMNNLMKEVQANAEFFATDTFTVEAIQKAVQRIDFAPYTSTPYPEEDHLEIIFTHNGGELICPEPLGAA